MGFDKLGPVKALRNNIHRTNFGVGTLIIGIIVSLIFGAAVLFPADYDERISLFEDEWVAYGVSIYGPMYEGDDVKIEFDVSDSARVDMFILDEKNYLNFIDGQAYGKLFDIEAPTSGKDITYTLIKDGAIYIIFHNTNTYSITLDVVITDETAVMYSRMWLLLGLVLITLGIISLTGKSEIEELEQFPISEHYPNQRQMDLICELCQRKFTSHEQLEEHYQKSELHRKNLEDYNKQKQY